jgi:hypothetical protein
MALYDPVDGVYRKVAKMYDPVSGVYRNVTKAFDPVAGVYRQYFSGGTPVGSLAVGDSVWLNVNGVQKEFLVVHQGNPDSAQYDASCDGTWLLMKDLYVKITFDSTNNDYQNSDIHAYLNSTFIDLLDSTVKSAIRQAKIPYVNGTGNTQAVDAGANGLPTKIFLLSGYEVGWTKSNNSYFQLDGACLSYFSGFGSTDTRRIAYYSGTATPWWLRSPVATSKNGAIVVTLSGYYDNYGVTHSLPAVRPAFILDSNTPIAKADGKNIIE